MIPQRKTVAEATTEAQATSITIKTHIKALQNTKKSASSETQKQQTAKIDQIGQPLSKILFPFFSS